MSGYLLVMHLHAGLAILTGVGFALRGFWRLGAGRPVRQRWLRVLPHLIDTLLLVSGLILMVWARLWPWLVPWFGFKLLLVVIYIGLGIAAFRSSGRSLGWTFFGLALLTWLWILGMAFNKAPAGWLA